MLPVDERGETETRGLRDASHLSRFRITPSHARAVRSRAPPLCGRVKISGLTHTRVRALASAYLEVCARERERERARGLIPQTLEVECDDLAPLRGRGSADISRARHARLAPPRTAEGRRGVGLPSRPINERLSHAASNPTTSIGGVQAAVSLPRELGRRRFFVRLVAAIRGSAAVR